jgi:hypothetical protein
MLGYSMRSHRHPASLCWWPRVGAAPCLSKSEPPLAHPAVPGLIFDSGLFYGLATGAMPVVASHAIRPGDASARLAIGDRRSAADGQGGVSDPPV